MIPIPASVKIKHDARDERLLLDKARAWLERDERTPGWHASDVLNPRRALFRKLLPVPLEDREVTIFLVGKVLHGFVLSALEGKDSFRETDSGSSYSEELALSYSPDWDKGEIAEFKTSRVFKEPKTVDDLGTYVQQLLIYMAAKDRTEAKLWVLLINLRGPDGRTHPQFACYKISISPEDLAATKAYIAQAVRDLTAAERAQDPKGLDLCWEFICGAKNCPYWHQCRPEGRYEASAA